MIDEESDRAANGKRRSDQSCATNVNRAIRRIMTKHKGRETNAEVTHDGLDQIQDFHRSHSPNTMSAAPSTAVTSASMWPFIMKSIACKWLNAVGRILQR